MAKCSCGTLQLPRGNCLEEICINAESEKSAPKSEKLFYVKKSVGKEGNIIDILKIKTMYDYADEYHLEALKKGFDENGKIDQSKNIILGRKWLRKYGIDELPQIPYNIFFKRNMKFVGLRPVKEETFKTYPENLQKKYIKIKPGWMGVNKSSFGSTDAEKNEIYLDKYEKNPLITDIVYFFNISYNILTGKVKNL
jgi:lipopolysaccharide/colanic/teichoic acid biosynthesis glycosyltransferase